MSEARLIIVRDRQYRTLELIEPVVSFGRSPDNTVPLEDDMASRRHCVIERGTDGQFSVNDLHSFNGTFCNGQPVREPQRLRHMDAVQIGQTFMLFLDDGYASASSLGTVNLLASTERPTVSETRAFEDAEVVAAKAARDVSDAGAREALQNMMVLQELNKAINSELDIDKLLAIIMDTAIDLMKAERGFIILVDDAGNLSFQVAHNFEHNEIHNPSFSVSRNILNKVLATREPIISTNAATDFEQFASIVDMELRSLMCVPLVCKDTAIGVVYLDSHLVEARFGQSSLNLLSSFSDQAAIAIENARLVRAVREKERLDQELRIASRIQGELLPREQPEVTGLDVCGRMITAKEVGGDYFDFVQFEGQDSVYCCVGDVSGKGVPAGLIMVMARSTLRPFISSYFSTKKILVETNKILKGDLKKGMFMSMVLLHWSSREGLIRFTGAGHERLLVYRAATQEVEVINGGGIILGVVPDVETMLQEQELFLGIGDHVIVYTDGITEARVGEGPQYGLEQLKQVVVEHGTSSAGELAEQILRSLEPFGAGAEQQHDDITLVVMRRTDSDSSSAVAG